MAAVREILPIEYWEKFYTVENKGSRPISHLEMIEDVESGRSILTDDWDINWLIIGMYHKRNKFVKMFLEINNVPEGLTIKEQLAYMQLLGSE